MTRLAVLMLTLAACGGAPFNAFPEPTETSTDGPLEPHDAAPDAPSAANDAAPAHDAAPKHDAAPEPPLDAALIPTPDAETCAPVTWAPPDDGSTQGPFKGCIVNADPSTFLPSSYAVVTPKADGCFLEPTPLACRCASVYSCVCLLAQTDLFCTGTKLLGCDDSLGAPVITCN
jgi:hypothetical protein